MNHNMGLTVKNIAALLGESVEEIERKIEKLTEEGLIIQLKDGVPVERPGDTGNIIEEDKNE